MLFSLLGKLGICATQTLDLDLTNAFSNMVLEQNPSGPRLDAVRHVRETVSANLFRCLLVLSELGIE